MCCFGALEIEIAMILAMLMHLHRAAASWWSSSLYVVVVVVVNVLLLLGSC